MLVKSLCSVSMLLKEDYYYYYQLFAGILRYDKAGFKMCLNGFHRNAERGWRLIIFHLCVIIFKVLWLSALPGYQFAS